MVALHTDIRKCFIYVEQQTVQGSSSGGSLRQSYLIGTLTCILFVFACNTSPNVAEEDFHGWPGADDDDDDDDLL